MSSKPLFDYFSSSALTLTVAGSTGISPFLTLFILAVVEKVDSELLDMGDVAERILTSWWALIILGVFSVGEILSKCIPALDEIIDSIEVFVVPILSVLATLATLGMLPNPGDVGGSRDLDSTVPEIETGGGGFGQAFLVTTKVFLVIAGIILSLLIHFLKMIVRLASLACSAGCCQPCITLVEITVVSIGLVVAIFSPIFAMVACVLFLIGGWYVITTKCCCKKKDNGAAADDDDVDDKGNGNGNDDGKKYEENEETRKTGAVDMEAGVSPPMETAIAVAIGDQGAVTGTTGTAPSTPNVGAKVY